MGPAFRGLLVDDYFGKHCPNERLKHPTIFAWQDPSPRLRTRSLSRKMILS
jgi:hypothetical protein